MPVCATLNQNISCCIFAYQQHLMLENLDLAALYCTVQHKIALSIHCDIYCILTVIHCAILHCHGDQCVQLLYTLLNRSCTMNHNDFALLAHFCYVTHYTYVYQHCDSGHIHCLKYNQSRIDWTYWSYSEWDHCKEHMITPMPTGVWGYSED